jgi:prepilin-type N-terminal cleavage/methylation domain-containing protein
MAEALMRARTPRTAQAGFSMIEMLMTAFVLAIGILGLTMLQTMSLRASRGSRSLSTALLVGQRVMDQVEMEGRLSWLNATNTEMSSPALTDMNLTYVSLEAAKPLDEYYLADGLSVTTKDDPLKFYQIATTRTAVAAAAVGSVSDFNVIVIFADATDANNAKVQRTVSLTRRIIHG